MNLEFKFLNYLLLRSVMGLNMLIHGAGRLFGDYNEFIKKMEKTFEPSFIPETLTTFSAHIISPLELIFGALLIVGLRTKETLLILTLNMAILITGVCILKKWDLAGLQMSYVLFLFFIGHYIEFNNYSLDHFIQKRRGSSE